MTRIRVVLADDHQLVRKGLHALLDHEPDIQVVGEAADGQEAIALVEKTGADVLVTDLEMPGMSGLETVRQIRRRRLPARVLVLTMYKDVDHILQAIRAGVSGYLPKDAAVSELAAGIRAAFRGEIYLSPAISTSVIVTLQELLMAEGAPSPLDTLTDREREVWQLIAEGYKRQEIAQRLHISPKTFDAHRANLLQKLNAKNNAALVQLAVRYGIIPQA